MNELNQHHALPTALAMKLQVA